MDSAFIETLIQNTPLSTHDKSELLEYYKQKGIDDTFIELMRTRIDSAIVAAQKKFEKLGKKVDQEFIDAEKEYDAATFALAMTLEKQLDNIDDEAQRKSYFDSYYEALHTARDVYKKDVEKRISHLILAGVHE